MKHNQSEKKRSTKEHHKSHRKIWGDLPKGEFKRTLRQDLKDIYDFYLDKDTKARLSRMGRFRRWITMQFWLMKSLFFKLPPVRRILLAVSLWMFIAVSNSIDIGDTQINLNLQFFGFVLLLFILALELKDKLLARSELAAGRTVQFALMPDESPRLSGWDIWLYTRPANEVGGDMVDYLWIREDRLGLALGDVAGKGLGAALFMAKLQATLRAMAPVSKSLIDLGKQLNTIFCRDGLPSRFISLFYCEVDQNATAIQILNAGHIPPFLWQKGKIKELPQGGPALGLHATSGYQKQSIEMHPGDLLLVYSDGLTEARSEEGEFFGEKRLMDLLSENKDSNSEAIGKNILAVIDRFTGHARQNDDLSMILLKRMK